MKLKIDISGRAVRVVLFSFLMFFPLSFLAPGVTAYAGQGKTSGPKIKKPIKNKKSEFTFKPLKNEEIPAGAKNITVIDLKTALRLALENYPGIQSSKYSYISSVYNKNETLYNYFPQISAGGIYSRETVMSVSSAGAGIPPTFKNNGGINYMINDYQADLNATWLIYSFGGRHYSYLASLNQMKVSKYAYSQETNSDLYNVVLNFAQYFENSEIEKADLENLKNNEIAYKAAEAFYRVGTGNLVDAETAKASMETARAEYINSKFNSKISRLALINSIGLPLNGKYQFVNTLMAGGFNENIGDLIKKGLKNSPLLLQSIYEVKSEKASVNEAKTGYYPSLSASFSYTGVNSVFPLNRNYAAGISLSVPIFNGFLTTNKVASSKALLFSSIWNRRLTEQNLIYTISQDYYGIKSQYLTIAALKQSEKASKLAYELALKSYKVGVGSMVQLVTANSQYISSLTSYINSKYTYYYLKDKLYSDIGLLYSHYFGKEKK